MLLHVAALHAEHLALGVALRCNYNLLIAINLVIRYASQTMLSLVPLIRDFCQKATLHATKRLSSFELTHEANSLILRADGRLSTALDYTWLRHNCRCPHCYDVAVYQREVQLHHLIEISTPKNISINKGNNTLEVKWCDDHDSVYSIKWLLDSLTMKRTITPQLWDASYQNADWPRVTYQEFQAPGYQGVGKILQHVLRSGFCLLEKTVQNNVTYEQMTQQIIEKICYVQKTFWGEMWHVSVDEEKADSGFSNRAVPPHNDGTYLLDAPGLIVFHCTKPAESGGETILVDGFKLADILSRDYPEAHRTLSTIPLEARFVNYEQGVSEIDDHRKHNYYNCDVILKHDAFTGKIVQTRFNALDMLPVRTVDQSEVRRVYKALGAISTLANDFRYAIRMMLKPGTVLFVDNFRVLHGREAFVGERVLCGGYIGRADWLSKARVLGIM